MDTDGDAATATGPRGARARRRDLLVCGLLAAGALAPVAGIAVAVGSGAQLRFVSVRFLTTAAVLPAGAAVAVLLSRTREVGRAAAVALAVDAAARLVGTGLLLTELAGGGARAGVDVVGLAAEVARHGLVLAAGAVVVATWQDTGPPARRAPTGVRRAVLVAGLVGAGALLLPSATLTPGPLGLLPLTGPFSPFAASPAFTVSVLAAVLSVVVLVVALATLADRRHRLGVAAVLLVTAVLPRVGPGSTFTVLGADTQLRGSAWPLVSAAALAAAALLALLLRPAGGDSGPPDG
jgi:hypothetical protein